MNRIKHGRLKILHRISKGRVPRRVKKQAKQYIQSICDPKPNVSQIRITAIQFTPAKYLISGIGFMRTKPCCLVATDWELLLWADRWVPIR